MFTRIQGNLLEDSGECYYFNISGNVEEISGECSRIFREMIVKTPGNAQEDSGELSKKFQGMFKKILGRLKTIPFSFLSLVEEKV